ncbi:SMI1/KNR4 family protein [Bremerella sp.]|uniref:SMI1/KNR4 family protein n=1 Tax=Bremerella sp. TaxID=2795602 RepID=UPI00391C6839
MTRAIDLAIDRIRAIGSHVCENQVYVFDDYDPHECDPTAVCQRLGIPYSDELFLSYPAERTFDPIPWAQIEAEEQQLGATLPDDYKTLLATFGRFHLPGRASICLRSPVDSSEVGQDAWSIPENGILAISNYMQESDGNMIGFIRNGEQFAPELYEFSLDLRWMTSSDQPWQIKRADSLADFVIQYLDQL